MASGQLFLAGWRCGPAVLKGVYKVKLCCLYGSPNDMAESI